MQLNITSKPLAGIQLHSLATNILNNCFTSLIIGPPGSGKTTIIEALIQDVRFYGQKFDQIIFVGPSSFPNLQIDQTNSLQSPDVTVIQKYIQQVNSRKDELDFHLLFVWDDCVTQMNQKSDYWKKLFLNRRHMVKNGTISHLITTQKFSLLPTFVRTCLTEIFVFKIPPFQLQAINRWIIPRQKSSLFATSVTNLKPNQFLFYNIQNSKLYNHQFNQVGKVECKLQIFKQTGSNGQQPSTSFQSFQRQRGKQQINTQTQSIKNSEVISHTDKKEDSRDQVQELMKLVITKIK